MTSLKSLMAKRSMQMLDVKAMKNLKGGKKSGGGKDRGGNSSGNGGNGELPDD